MSQVRAVADYGDLCGEGPTWDPDSGWLYWTDIEGHRFFRCHQASDKHEIVKQGLEIAGYSLNRPGGVLVANSRGIWLWDGADGLRLIVDQVANSDRELEQRGHRFVRYADDCNIYVRSPRAGQRVMASVTRYITRRLKLKMNESKSAVARPEERKFLGFSFTGRPSPKRCLAPKAKQRFKERIRELTRPGTGSEPAALLSRNEPLRNDEAKAFRQTAAHHALVSQSKGANKALNGLRSVDAMQVENTR